MPVLRRVRPQVSAYQVEVTRTVKLLIEASSLGEARLQALGIAWGWQPDEADEGQGKASACVLRQVPA